MSSRPKPPAPGDLAHRPISSATPYVVCRGPRAHRPRTDHDFDWIAVGDPVSVYTSSGRAPRILDGAALDGLAPQVVVNGVELLLVTADRDLPLGGQLHAVSRVNPQTPAGAECPGRGPGRVRPPRSAPGRCPCRCSRGRPTSHRAVGPRPPGAARSPGATRPRPTGIPLVSSVRLQGRDAELLGQLAPCVDHHRLDRSGGQGPGPYGIPVLTATIAAWPTSTATATTSTPSFSMSQRTATDVSRPPL